MAPFFCCASIVAFWNPWLLSLAHFALRVLFSPNKLPGCCKQAWVRPGYRWLPASCSYSYGRHRNQLESNGKTMWDMVVQHRILSPPMFSMGLAWGNRGVIGFYAPPMFSTQNIQLNRSLVIKLTLPPLLPACYAVPVLLLRREGEAAALLHPSTPGRHCAGPVCGWCVEV